MCNNCAVRFLIKYLETYRIFKTNSGNFFRSFSLCFLSGMLFTIWDSNDDLLSPRKTSVSIVTVTWSPFCLSTCKFWANNNKAVMRLIVDLRQFLFISGRVSFSKSRKQFSGRFFVFRMCGRNFNLHSVLLFVYLRPPVCTRICNFYICRYLVWCKV